MIELGVIFGGALVVMLLLGSLLLLVLGKQRRFKARVERIGARARPMSSEERREHQLRKKTTTSSPFLEGLAGKLLPNPDQVRIRLSQTGKRISLGRYLVVSFLIGCVTGVMVVVLAGFPWFVGLLIGIGAGVGAPHMVVGWMVQRRRNKFTALFPDAIDLMVRGLRSGLPVTETIAACGREMSDPVGPEFRAIADSVRLGQTLEESLWQAAARLDTPEFKFFVISLSVQKETGGNLGETLANLSEILRNRKQMRLKIKAMSSEANASALILGSLPFVMFILIYLVNSDYEQVLLTDARGRVMLGAGVGMMGAGALVMRKMIRFDI